MWKNTVITYIGFVLSVCVLGWFSYNYYDQLKTYTNYTNAVEHSYKILMEIQNLDNSLKEAETAQRGFLLTEDSIFLQPYISILNDIGPTFNKLTQLAKDNPRQKKNLKDLRFIMMKRIEYLREGTILFKSENKIFKRKLRNGKDLMDRCDIQIQKIKKEEQRLLIIRNAQEEKFKNTTSSYSIGAFIFALTIFIVTFLLIIREFRDKVVNQRILERKVEELNTSNAELEQIAFVASHDFQEPVRKILTFSDLLKTKYAHVIPTEGQYIFERINYSSRRLKEVLDGLVNFTTSVRSNEELQPISLIKIIQNVKHITQAAFPEREFDVIIRDGLPPIMGFPTQLQLLFECLFSNAIKFSKQQEPVVITITAQSAHAREIKKMFKNQYTNDRYIKISLQDHGIGFENEFAQKIFVLFQRLHSQDSNYAGKGIGLSLVKRIMHNHHGYVNAEGKINQGAIFTLFFPVKIQ